MATLEIGLLGGFGLQRDGKPLGPVPSRAARSLFAFLVMNRDRTHTRDLVAGTFWPDLPDATARRRLSHALWQIRATLGDAGAYVVTAGDHIGFDRASDHRLDVEEFERALAGAETASRTGDREEEVAGLETAVALYRGDLLAGLYDDWMVPEQERLRARQLGALERLTELTMAAADLETALIHARRLARSDPLREEAHRRVMRIAVLLGRHNEAIRQFETCRRILAEELEAEPSPETLDLYRATRRDREMDRRDAAAGPQPLLYEGGPAIPMIGRERERTALVEHLDAAIDGTGGVVLLEGDGGVGKTRLLAEAASDARWRGMDVLWGRMSPSGGRPYEAIASALEALSPLRARQMARRLDPVWRTILGPLVPALRDGPGGAPAASMARTEQRSRMRQAVADAVASTGASAPTLLVLEDLHWADEDTIATVGLAAARLAGTRTVMAVSYRHVEARERNDVWSVLRDVDRLPHCRRVSLAPLTPAGTEELIRAALGRTEVESGLSERVHRETAGNPLLILETLRVLYEDHDLDEGGSASPPRSGTPLTPMLNSLIRHRLDGLGPTGQATLEVLAVHDGELTLPEVLACSALPEEEVLDALDLLLQRRLATDEDGRYRVAHELLRRAAYEAATPSTRMDLHRRVGLEMERSRPDEVEALAHHFAAARMPDRAAGYLERSAERALQVQAYDTAALHLAHAAEALDAIEAAAEHRFRIAVLQEEVLDTLGRRDRQEVALRRMARFGAPADEPEIARRRAWWLAHESRFPEAEAEAKRSQRLAAERGDEGAAVAAVSALGLIACYAGRATDGIAHLEEAAGLEGADTRQRADAHNALGQNLIDLQRFDEAEPHLRAALDAYGELGDPRGRSEVLTMIGMLHLERGEPEHAAASFDEAIGIARSIGYRYGEAVTLMNLGILHALANRASQALQCIGEALDAHEGMGNRRGRAIALSNRAWLRHSWFGDTERAVAEATEALAVYREIGDARGEAQATGMLGSMAAARGRAGRALGLMNEGLRRARELEDAWLSAQSLRELALTEVVLGRAGAALEHALEAERLCEERGMADLAVSVQAAKGRALLACGRVSEALEATGRAMLGLRPGMDLKHQVPFAHSLALQAAGRSAEAEAHLELAYRGLEEMLGDLTDEQRRAAIDNVPANREVAERWRAARPRRAEVQIAAADAPRGRPLGDDDLVAVTWTVAAPGDERAGGRVEVRRHRLQRLLAEASAQGGAPTVDDLSGALGASPATVRRDLAALRRAGDPAATRGTRATPARSSAEPEVQRSS